MMLAPKRVSPALSMCVLLALATASFLMSVPTAEAQKDYACTAGSKMVCFATSDPVLCADLESQINGMGKLQWPIPPGAVNPKQHFNCTDIVPQSMPGPMPGADDGKYFCLDIEIDTGYNNRVKGAWGLTGNKAFLEKYTASKPLMLSFQCSMGNAMPVSSNNAVGTWYPLAVGVPDVQPDDFSNILPGPDGTRTNLIMNVGADIKAADAGKHRKLNWYPGWKASIPRLDVNIRFYFQDFVGSGILVEPTVKLPSSFPNASYVTFVAPYLKSDFADAYLDGSDSISAGVTDFVTAGGVLVVFASTKSAMPYSQVCAAPLALMNAVLGDTGCSCQLDNIYDGVPIVPVANVDTDVAEAIFTADSYTALVNASSDVLLDVGLVGGVPLDCSGGVEGSNLMPVFAEDQDSGELTSTGLGLTRVWSLGNGYVIYAGAAVTPEANIFSSNSTWANRDVWRQLLRSIARMPVPPQDESPLAK